MEKSGNATTCQFRMRKRHLRGLCELRDERNFEIPSTVWRIGFALLQFLCVQMHLLKTFLTTESTKLTKFFHLRGRR